MRAWLVLALAALAAQAASVSAYSLSFATDTSCRAIIAALEAPDNSCVHLDDGRGYFANCTTHTFTFCEDAACSTGCVKQPFVDARCGKVPSADVAPMRARSFRADCAAMATL